MRGSATPKEGRHEEGYVRGISGRTPLPACGTSLDIADDPEAGPRLAESARTASLEGNSSMRRLSVLALVTLATLLAAPSAHAALAAPPDTFRIPYQNSFIDEGASDACGFPVRADISGVATIQVWYDDAGNPVRIQIHNNDEGTFSANGNTVRQIERGQIFLDPIEGTDTEVGLILRVFLPGGGSLMADVGRLVFDAEGNVTFEAGPHPALHGDFTALCAALS
jgi:hypothetical protein